MTNSGRRIWQVQALPKIHSYYEQILSDLSINDVTHALHYLLKILEHQTVPSADEAESHSRARR